MRPDFPLKRHAGKVLRGAMEFNFRDGNRFVHVMMLRSNFQLLIPILTILFHFCCRWPPPRLAHESRSYFHASASGILAPRVYLYILVYHMGICWYTMLYDIRRHHCIYLYMLKYEKIFHDILVYTSICSRQDYILVYSRILYFTVYSGIWLFMTVYTFEIK